MQIFLALLIGYSLGSISFAVIISRAVSGIDVRNYYSGTAGAANVGRLLGKKYGVIVAISDVTKGMIAVIIGRLIGGEICQVIAGIAAIIGHIFPIWFGFKGGKAIATFFGSCIFIAPLVLLPVGVMWLVLYFISRKVPQSSAISALSLPVLGLLFRYPWVEMSYLLIAGLTICFRHVLEFLPFVNRY